MLAREQDQEVLEKYFSELIEFGEALLSRKL